MSGVYKVGSIADIKALLISAAVGAGAALVAFLQTGVGAVLRTVQSKLQETISVADFGVTGDGVTNDTVNVQKAIDAVNAAGGGLLWFPRATYMLGKVYLKSNVTLIFCPGTVLQAINNVFDVNDRFFNIDGVSNWGIYGNWARIRMNNEYAAGEQRHCVFMVDAHNGFIKDLRADDSGGDGFYIGRNAVGTHCTNIVLDNCHANGNRRQGMSIVSAVGLLVRGGEYSGTSGTSPACGIDMEPNDSGDELDRIELVNVRTRSNAGGGILVMLKNLVSTADKKVSISIIGCKSYLDAAAPIGASAAGALRITGDGAAWANTLTGSIVVRDFQAIDCNRSAIFIQDWDYQKGCLIDIDGVSAVNPNANNTAAQPFDKCGIAVYTSGTTAGVGNFNVRNMRTSGANLYAGAYMADTNGPIRNFSLHDVICAAAATSSGVVDYVSAGGPNVESSVTYSQERTTTVTLSGSVANYPGVTMETTLGGAFTLPLASDVIGQRFKFRNMSDTSTNIIPATGDVILGWSLGTGVDGKLVMNLKGDTVELRATSLGWAPEYVSWYAQRPATSGATNITTPRRIVWVTAMPAHGTFKRGDRAVNVNATIGQPKGWIRMTDGANHVLNTDWASEGNL